MFKLIFWVYPLGLLLWIVVLFIYYCLLFVAIETPALRWIYFPYLTTELHFQFILSLFVLRLTASYPDSFIDECIVLGIPVRRSLRRWLVYLYVFLRSMLGVIISPLVTQLFFKAIFLAILPISEVASLFGTHFVVPFVVAVATFLSLATVHTAPQDEMANRVAQNYLSGL